MLYTHLQSHIQEHLHWTWFPIAFSLHNQLASFTVIFRNSFIIAASIIVSVLVSPFIHLLKILAVVLSTLLLHTTYIIRVEFDFFDNKDTYGIQVENGPEDLSQWCVRRTFCSRLCRICVARCVRTWPLGGLQFSTSTHQVVVRLPLNDWRTYGSG